MLRKLIILLGVTLVPAIATGQIVITGADREDDSTSRPAAEAGAADSAKRDESKEATKAKRKKSDDEGATKKSEDPESLEVPPPAVQIEGLGTDDSDETEAEDITDDDEPGDDAISLDDPADPPAKLEDVKAAIEEAVRDRLRECIADTKQPTKAGLQGAWSATEQGEGSVVVRPQGVTFSDEMFRNAFESADDPVLKDELASRRTSFEECIANVEVELDGRMPVQELRVQGNLVWFNRNVLLRDVVWTETPTATAEPVSNK